MLATSTALLASAAIAGGTALYSGSQQKKAAGKALDAQTLANDKSLAEQAAARQQITQLQQPFVNTGYSALDALSQQFGLSESQTQGAAQPTAQAQPQAQPAGPDYSAYMAANPDVMAEYQRVAATADRNSPQYQKLGLDRGPEGFAAYHYQQYGQGEGRQLPTTQPAQQAAAAPAQAKPAGGNAGVSPTQPAAPNLMTQPRPEAAPAPSFDRPTDLAVPTYQRPTDRAAPVYGDAPELSSYLDNFEASPDYEFRRSQGLDAANSGFAARGMLKSGAAAKGISDYASNLASGEYQNWFARQMQQYNADNSQYNTDRAFDENAYRYGQDRGDNIFAQDRSYGTNLWNTQQGRQDQNFAEDRAFGTDAYRYDTGRTDANFNADRANANNRYDTNTGNLFSLAQMGQNAAGATGAAGSAYANNAGNIFGSQANAASDAAGSRAQANAGMFGAVGGALAQGVGAFTGGAYGQTTPFAAQGTQSISAANPFQLSAGTSRIPNVVF